MCWVCWSCTEVSNTSGRGRNEKVGTCIHSSKTKPREVYSDGMSWMLWHPQWIYDGCRYLKSVDHKQAPVRAAALWFIRQSVETDEQPHYSCLQRLTGVTPDSPLWLYWDPTVQRQREYFIIFLNLNVPVICLNIAQRDIKASSRSIFSYATSTWVHNSQKNEGNLAMSHLIPLAAEEQMSRSKQQVLRPCISATCCSGILFYAGFFLVPTDEHLPQTCGSRLHKGPHTGLT